MLVANGPSLNEMGDLSFLRNHTVIGLNKIHLGLKRFGFYPKYLVCVNEKVLEQAGSEICKLNCIHFISSHCRFPRNPLNYPIVTQGDLPRFSKDISVGVNQGWTVTFAALQIAYFLGFEEVAIIGLDHSFTFSGKPNEAKVMEGDDVNHFDPAYFAAGVSWDNPDLTRSEESYEVALNVFRSSSRKIVNLTPNSKCEVFPKSDWVSYFSIQHPYAKLSNLVVKAGDAKSFSTSESEHLSLDINGIKLVVDKRDKGGLHYKQRQHYEEVISPIYPAIESVLKPEVAFDIGANYGFTSSIFMNKLGIYELVAVEPDSNLHGYLGHNIQFNNRRGVSVNCFAAMVGDTEGIQAFGINPNGSQDNRVVAQPGWDQVSVSSVRLQTLLSVIARGRPTFIKIDTQGYDPVVIRSGKAYLSTHDNWLIKSEFAPNWMDSQGLNPTMELLELCRNYNVVELPSRVPYGFQLRSLSELVMPADLSYCEQFVSYVRSQNENGLGWVDILVFSTNAGWL